MTGTTDAVSNLREQRDRIDNVDAAIVHLLAERFRCTRAIGRLKAECRLPACDPAREAEQIGRLRHLAIVSKLDPDFAEEFLASVFREVVRHHDAVRRVAVERLPRNGAR
jgi:chorismate mutase